MMKHKLLRREALISIIMCFVIFYSNSTSFSAELIFKDSSKIKGSVMDEASQSPIPDVNIYFEETNIGTISDQNGDFYLPNAPTGQNVLLVKHIGYLEKRISLNTSPGQTKHLNILLTPKTLNLSEVVFTASRHAETVFKSQTNVAIASNEKIAVRTSPNTADALREIPGVLVQKTTAGHGAPIIRGMIGKDVLLLYNGIRLNKPTFRFGANQYMNTINVESLDRIEVTKGPGSVMFGSDAIGGVVNMITESAALSETAEFNHFSFSSRYGTADQARIVNAAFANRIGKMVLSGGVGLKKIGDLTAGKDIGKQTPTGYDEWNANLRLGLPISSQTSIDFDILAVQQDEVPRYDKYVTDEYEQYLYDPQNRYLAAMTFQSRPVHLNWINSIKWNLSWQLEEEGTVERKTSSTTLTKNRNNLTTFGSYLQINSTWRNLHVLTYGYEIYGDKLNSSRTKEKDETIESQRGDYPDGSTYRSMGLFLNDNLVFSTKFDMTMGLRWSYIWLSSMLEQPFGKFEDDYNDLTGTFGLSYKPTLWLNLIARYAKGFRAPNFNDTVVLKISNAGVDAPSPGLSPEKSHNFEVGIKLDQTRVRGSIFVFYNRIVDLIDRYRGVYAGLDFYDENGNGLRDAAEVDIYQKRNVDNAYIAGWELQGQIQLNEKWRLQGFSFWTYGQDITLDEPMSRIPPLMIMANFEYSPTKQLSLEAFIRAATKQDRLSSRDKDDSRILPGGTLGWKTVNFRCSWELLSDLRLSLIFENILDETYKEHGSGVYSPGRSLVLGFRYGG